MEIKSKYEKLNQHQKDLIEGKGFEIFDAREVNRFKHTLYPQDSYLEELLLPRVSSPYRYILHNGIYGVSSGFFGISVAINRGARKPMYFLSYAVMGLCYSVPYMALNEIYTGFL